MQEKEDDFDARTKEFEDYLKRRGVVMSPKVAIADFRSAVQGRGLIALEEIQKEELLFSIPQSAQLRADHDPVLRKLLEKYELDVWPALIVRMLAVQDTEDWKPYFDVLPTEFNTPMFWTQDEINKYLRGSEVIEKIGREEADALYDQLAEGILKEEYFAGVKKKSREDFHRMASIIMSYAFDIPKNVQKNEEDDEEFEGEPEIVIMGSDEESSEDEEIEYTKAMVPLADMLNSHTKLRNARLTIPNTPEGNYDMIASKRIKKGQQIYNIYGNQPSSDMLRRYGFVEAGGTNFEVIEVPLEFLVDQACKVLKLPKDVIEKRVDALENLVEEVPNAFEVGLTNDEEIEDAPPEVELEPRLIVAANALCVEKLKRRDYKKIVSMIVDDETMYAEARELLTVTLKALRARYGDLPAQPVPKNPEARVLLDKADMGAQVQLSEVGVIDMALDWLDNEDAIDPEQPKPKKRRNK